jgi:hypothetical protein
MSEFCQIMQLKYFIVVCGCVSDRFRGFFWKAARIGTTVNHFSFICSSCCDILFLHMMPNFIPQLWPNKFLLDQLFKKAAPVYFVEACMKVRNNLRSVIAQLQNSMHIWNLTMPTPYFRYC